jgi:hypothetical protein
MKDSIQILASTSQIQINFKHQHPILATEESKCEKMNRVRMSYVPNGIWVPTHGADWGRQQAVGVSFSAQVEEGGKNGGGRNRRKVIYRARASALLVPWIDYTTSASLVPCIQRNGTHKGCKRVQGSLQGRQCYWRTSRLPKHLPVCTRRLPPYLNTRVLGWLTPFYLPWTVSPILRRAKGTIMGDTLLSI